MVGSAADAVMADVRDLSERATGPAAKFFEDFTVGDCFVTQGRTVSETELTMWAMYTGDLNPMHVDAEYARAQGLFGGRFPPGLMSVALASGLKERLGLFAGTGLAMRSQTINYRSPVLTGDTICVRLEVRKTAPHPKRPAGTITFGYEIVKHDGTVAIDGDWVILVASRES